MTTFIHEPDAYNEPTLWALERGDTDQYQYTGLLSRCNLAPDVRRFWPDVVARMTGTVVTTDDATRATLRRTLENAVWPFLAHDPAKPEAFWPMMVDSVLAALTGVPHD